MSPTPARAARRSSWRRALAAAAIAAGLALIAFLGLAISQRPIERQPSPAFEAAAPPPAPGAVDVAGGDHPTVGPHALAEVEVSAVDAEAYASIPLAPAGEPLAPAPDAQLVEAVRGRSLPKVGTDGRRSWQVYARPFDFHDDRPRLVVIALGFGLSHTASEAAITRLPAPVGLALDAYAQDGARWTARARHDGHEVLLSLPLEPADRDHIDPGPRALLTTLGAADNLRRLEALLSAASGYVGLIARDGGRFVNDVESLRPILAAVQGRGLMFVDATFADGRPAMRFAGEIALPRVQADIVLDAVPTAAAIDAQLAALEKIAQSRGLAVGVCGLDPGTLKRLAAWWPSLPERNFTLAPVSAAADAQVLP